MAVISEVSALELELDPDTLPLASVYLALRFAIRETRLNRLNKVAELARYHAEEKDDPVFVNRLVTQTTEVDRITVGGTIAQGVVTGTR